MPNSSPLGTQKETARNIKPKSPKKGIRSRPYKEAICGSHLPANARQPHNQDGALQNVSKHSAKFPLARVYKPRFSPNREFGHQVGLVRQYQKYQEYKDLKRAWENGALLPEHTNPKRDSSQAQQSKESGFEKELDNTARGSQTQQNQLFIAQPDSANHSNLQAFNEGRSALGREKAVLQVSPVLQNADYDHPCTDDDSSVEFLGMKACESQPNVQVINQVGSTHSGTPCKPQVELEAAQQATNCGKNSQESLDAKTAEVDNLKKQLEAKTAEVDDLRKQLDTTPTPAPADYSGIVFFD